MRTITLLLMCCLLFVGCDTADPVTALLDDEPERFDTLFALSEAMGFNVHSLYTLPMGYREASIERLGTVALTTYRSDTTGATIYFYMAEGTVDLSSRAGDAPGDEIYRLSRGGLAVEARGDADHIFFAAWCENGYSYCIDSDVGIDPLVFRKMLDDIK